LLMVVLLRSILPRDSPDEAHPADSQLALHLEEASAGGLGHGEEGKPLSANPQRLLYIIVIRT
jgi:hypothetical protein